MEKLNSKPGIILDNDGTLVDTDELILQSFENNFRNLGVKFTREQISSVLGPSLETCYRTFVPGADILRLCETHIDFQRDNPHLIKTYPGVLETLEELRKRGYPLAITTNWYGGFPASLRITGIDQIVKTVITCEDVANPKPHPEMIYKASSLLGIDPQDAYMAGDSPTDIHAAKAAGVRKIIGVDHKYKKRKLLLATGAHQVIHNFQDLLGLI